VAPPLSRLPRPLFSTFLPPPIRRHELYRERASRAARAPVRRNRSVKRRLAHARAELGLLALERLDPARRIRQFLRLPERELLAPGFRCALDGGTRLGKRALALSFAWRKPGAPCSEPNPSIRRPCSCTRPPPSKTSVEATTLSRNARSCEATSSVPGYSINSSSSNSRVSRSRSWLARPSRADSPAVRKRRASNTRLRHLPKAR